jgi:aryl carrier-like protein
MVVKSELINCLLENIDSIKEWKDWKEKKSTIEFEKLRADVLIDKLCRILSSSNNYISDHNPILFIED